MIEVEFDLKMPDGKVIGVTAWGSVYYEQKRHWLEEVSFDAWIYRNSSDLEGRQLSFREIQDFEQWCDLGMIVDERLYDRWNEVRYEMEVI